ncbi:UNVERIFIED_CONTAM: hypothetical protein LK11_00855 [Mumia flava]|uniref:hypothetical protein n=1 Tax=Mumia flava TaxID=1348852 RepID=UPI000573D6C1|nr:hypothetical protein [Mumia flava]
MNRTQNTIDPAALYRTVTETLSTSAELYDVGGIVATLLDADLDDPTTIPADVFWLAVADNALPPRTGPCPQALPWCTAHGFSSDPGEVGWHEHKISEVVSVVLDQSVSEDPRVVLDHEDGGEAYYTPSGAQALAEDLVRAAAYIAGIQ